MSDKKIYLVSPGGSGCNLMYHLFGEETLKAGWTWPNVHQRFTQLPDPENAKVLYLMANPLNILISFERRFWHLENWPDMINALGADLNGMHNVKDPKTDRPTLERYAEYGQNLFDFAGHAAQWRYYCRTRSIPSFFVRYEDLPAKMDLVRDFLGAEQLNPFEWKERKAAEDVRNNKDLSDRLARIHPDDMQYWNEIEYR